MNLITAGIKNALERGESIEQAIQSFRNAGYSEEDISKSVEEIKGWNLYNAQNATKITSYVPIVKEVKEEKISEEGYKKLPGIGSYEVTNKRVYLPYILIVLLGLLFIIGAALLGLYWNQLF